MNYRFSAWMKSVCEGNATIGTLHIGYKGYEVRKGNILKVLSKRHRLVVKTWNIIVAVSHAKYWQSYLNCSCQSQLSLWCSAKENTNCICCSMKGSKDYPPFRQALFSAIQLMSACLVKQKGTMYPVVFFLQEFSSPQIALSTLFCLLHFDMYGHHYYNIYKNFI